uniref:Uncharacterized protein n=1 Tax=Anguilla anguilla TaxID=7936 RepID=A0A0E9XE47_ANGAN
MSAPISLGMFGLTHVPVLSCEGNFDILKYVYRTEISIWTKMADNAQNMFGHKLADFDDTPRHDRQLYCGQAHTASQCFSAKYSFA